VLSYEVKVTSFVMEIGLSGYYLDDPHSGFGAEALGSVTRDSIESLLLKLYSGSNIDNNHCKIQIIQPMKCNSFTSLLLDVYVWLNMFRASPRPSSGAYNCTRKEPLV